MVTLDLPPAKQKLLWKGKELQDHEYLWDLEVRTDDEIMLEFESPAMPKVRTQTNATFAARLALLHKHSPRCIDPGASSLKDTSRTRIEVSKKG